MPTFEHGHMIHSASSESTLNHSVKTLLTFLLICVSLLIRFNDQIHGGTFWAEDGMIFFPDSLTAGIWAVLTPVFATLVVAQRLIAWVVSFLFLDYAPYAYCIVAGLLYAIPFTYLCSNSFTWLIPSRSNRTVLAVLLAIGPGSPEVFGNLTCLTYSISFSLALTLLAEGSASRRWFLPAWILGAVSSNAVAILLPLAVSRSLIERDRNYRLPILLCLGSLFAHAFLAIYSQDSVTQARVESFSTLFQEVGGLALAKGVLLPLTGLRISEVLKSMHPYLPFLVGAMLAIAVIASMRRTVFDRRFRFLAIGVFCCLVFFFLSHRISRSYELSTTFSNRHTFFIFSLMLPIVVGYCYRLSLLIGFAWVRAVIVIIPFLFLSLDITEGLHWRKAAFNGSWENFWPSYKMLQKSKQETFTFEESTGWLPVAGPGYNSFNKPWCQIRFRIVEGRFESEIDQPT